MLFQAGENFQNYHQILKEYRAALVIREKRIDDLYNEIKIIKKLLILNVIYIKISSFYFHLNNENVYLTIVLFVANHDNLNAS